MFPTELVTVGYDTTQETVALTAIDTANKTITANFVNAHLAGVPVTVAGGFSSGVIPTTVAAGSTGFVMKMFGDINSDGLPLYIEYTCDTANGLLYRNAMSWTAGAKPALDPSMVLLRNIAANPLNAPCFSYQTQTVAGAVRHDVAITLTCRRSWSIRSRSRSRRNEGASERIAAKHLQRVGAGQHRPVRPRAADAARSPRFSRSPMLKDDARRRTKHDERGTALVVSMLLMMVLSVLSASMMFLAQTETASSASYRLMSQARYGAESGVHSAINYLTNTYVLPGTPADPLANYDLTKSPVTNIANNQPVILSSNTAVVASNYPILAVQTAFNNAVRGNLTAGNQTVSYTASAKLLRMTPLVTYGGVSTVVQTWEITADGSVAGARSATVEVTSTLEQQIVPAAAYAAFATGAGCGALNFHGNNTETDSYNSVAPLVGGNPNVSNSGGNVGTNGNLTEGGGADIYGTLSSPRVGIGDCSAGNVSALSSSGGATVNNHNPPLAGDIVNLPQTVSMPLPPVPAGVPTTSFNGNGQTLLNNASVGNVTVNAHSTLTLGAPCAPRINVNSSRSTATRRSRFSARSF